MESDEQFIRRRYQEILTGKQSEKELQDFLVWKQQVVPLGWDKPGEEGVNEMVGSLRRASGEQSYREQTDIFSQLKKAAGGKTFTYLGRLVTPDMTFEDVLAKIPIGELETAASVGRGLAINAWKRLVPSAPPLPPTKGGGVGQLPIFKAASLAHSSASYLTPQDKGEYDRYSEDPQAYTKDQPGIVKFYFGKAIPEAAQDVSQLIEGKTPDRWTKIKDNLGKLIETVRQHGLGQTLNMLQEQKQSLAAVDQEY